MKTKNILILLMTILGLGCATSAPKQSAPMVPVAETATLTLDVDGVVQESRRLHREGLDFLLSGETIAADARFSRAKVVLRDATSECALREDCILDPFLNTWEDLLREQSIALTEAMERLTEWEEGVNEDALMAETPSDQDLREIFPEIERTEALLRGTDFDAALPLNNPVKAELDDWLTWRRPLLISSWENYQYLRDQIAPIYQEAGLPEALLFAMIATETGGKAHAQSRAGAAGLLQFMPSTGRRYGLNTRDGFDERLDPVKATKANVAYLNDQFAGLNDELDKALAAYNGGENRMRGIHRRNPGATFWDSRIYWSLPRETRQYVPRIFAAAKLFLHPDQYGVEWPTVETQRSTVILEREASLGELAICLGSAGDRPEGWFRTLRNLNPRWQPRDRAALGTEVQMPTQLVDVYAARCLDAEEDLVVRAEALFKANYPPEPPVIKYRVRRGDTLNSIAGRHRCANTRQLATVNGIRAPRYLIRVGQTLKIPTCS